MRAPCVSRCSTSTTTTATARRRVFDAWRAALQRGIDEIARFGADALVVALGVDTVEGDPISRFLLKSDDYRRIGAAVGACGLPTVFTMEGGYAVAEVGVNVDNVLEGFSGS
jgi:acetoin utilization deacetylase AcuC-like enzyme